MSDSTAVATPDDRAARAADVAMWLFAASIVMLVASLVSGYVLLRMGSESWPAPWRGGGPWTQADPWFRLVWLAAAAVIAATAARQTPGSPSWLGRHPLAASAIAGSVFLVRTLAAGRELSAAGHGPATHIAPATWFALNGTIAVLVLGGVFATLAVARATADAPGRLRRTRLLARYWWLMTACFAAVAVGMYVL